MKKISLCILSLVLLLPAAIRAAQNVSSDPVVMTVGGIDVKLSEFEYLYGKNNSQQASAISLDEYVDMFVNYKLKVRAARAAGLDTAQSYRDDMARYSAELAAPYMIDAAMRDSLVRVAYDHRCHVVTVRHLLLPHGQEALADSLRAAVMAGADFEDAVRRYSADPMARNTGGLLRFTGGMLPYVFEDMAYNLPVGTISPVFRSDFGLHFLKVEGIAPDPGEVKVRHILIRHADGDESFALSRIDSIGNLIRNGADFRQMASQFTDDPSGRGNGGELPWFGVGQMISEFESAAFALSDGALSSPVRTQFGYHLLLREASRPTPTIDSLRPVIEQMIDSDSRRMLLERRAADVYGRSVGVKVFDKNVRRVNSVFGKCGGLNDESRRRLAAMTDPVLSVGQRKVSAAEVAAAIPASLSGDAHTAADAFAESLTAMRYTLLRQSDLATLADRCPDYRNLLNEYSDGMLLYEISNREVWDRANTDIAGLEAFFAQNRDHYTWQAPHYKGFVITAVSDSVADAACAFLDKVRPDAATIATELRKQFGNNVRADRVIAAGGESPIVDYVAFGAQAPQPSGRWKAWRKWNGEILDQPSSALDVKGPVSIAYQQKLEADWLQRLHDTYPVVIYRDLLPESH